MWCHAITAERSFTNVEKIITKYVGNKNINEL